MDLDFSTLAPLAPQPKQPARTARQPSQPARSIDIDRLIKEEGADAYGDVIRAIYAQESGSGADTRTSVDKARGGMQVIPDTFRRVMPDGDMNDPEHLLRAGVRYAKQLGDRFGGDPARIAVGYFSGEGNVNASGGAPYLRDAKDGNGKSVSGYVADVLQRAGVKPGAKAEPVKWSTVAADPEFKRLSPEDKEKVRNTFFETVILPQLATDQVAEGRALFDERTGPTFMRRAVDAVKRFGAGLTEGQAPGGVSLTQAGRDVLGGVQDVKALGAGAGAFFGAASYGAQAQALADMDAVDAGRQPAALQSGGPRLPSDPGLVYLQAGPQERATMRQQAQQQLLGSKEFVADMVRAYQGYRAEKQRLSGEMPDLRNVGSVGDFAEYLARNVPAATPTMVASMAAAFLGGMPALMLSSGAMAVGDLTGDRIDSVIKGNDPRRFTSADRAADAAAAIDAEAAPRLSEHTGETIAAAVPYMLLDRIGPAATVARGETKRLIKGGVKELAKQSGLEFINEGGQAGVSIGAEMMAGERPAQLTADDAWRIANEGVVGAAVGGGAHIVSSGAKSLTRREEKPEERAGDEPLPAGEVLDGVEPPPAPPAPPALQLSAPVQKAEWEVVDGQQGLPPPAQPPGGGGAPLAPPALPAPQGPPPIMVDSQGNAAVQPAAAAAEATTRATEREAAVADERAGRAADRAARAEVGLTDDVLQAQHARDLSQANPAGRSPIRPAASGAPSQPETTPAPVPPVRSAARQPVVAEAGGPGGESSRTSFVLRPPELPDLRRGLPGLRKAAPSARIDGNVLSVDEAESRALVEAAARRLGRDLTLRDRLADAGAAHIEPGQPAEPATAPTVDAAVKKAAAATDRKAPGVRRALIEQIDNAMQRALADDHPDAAVYATAAARRPDVAALRRRGLKDDALARQVEVARNMIEASRAEIARRIGFVNFDVPGDGRFKVLNTRARLAEFRADVMKSPGFAARPGRVARAEASGVQGGSPSARDAIKAMIDDGDAQAAADYAAAKGLDLQQALAGDRLRLAKVASVEPTRVERDDLTPATPERNERPRSAEGSAAQEPAAPREPAKPRVDHEASAERSPKKGSPQAEERRIEDAGEKIGGARKDRWHERGLTVGDLDAMSEAEGADVVNKANVWAPDYRAMVERGTPAELAAAVKVIVDRLAARPRHDTPEGRRRYVQAMQAVREVYGSLKPEGGESVSAAMRRAENALHERLGVRAADFAAAQAARLVLFSIYKGRSDPFAFGYGEQRRAHALAEAGFPEKAAPWTRHFYLRETGGPTLTRAGVDGLVQRAAELGSAVTAEQVRAGVHLVVSKANQRVVAMAPSKADAEAAAAVLYERSLAERRDDKVLPERPHLDKLDREGLPQRIDRDVTPDDFLREFGFRGVEFGNWAAGDERQRMLNMAFDGLHDLAAILGVPPAALSLNGRLGMAFGARGGGRFAAHYEPGKLVINMTKLSGGGSLAHEWAHAFDHYLGELDRADAYEGKARGGSGWYARADYSGAPQRRMVREGHEWVARDTARLDNLRPELGQRFNAVMRAIFEKGLAGAMEVRTLELELERAQAALRDASEADKAERVQAAADEVARAKRRLAARVGPAASKAGSDFLAEARKLSGKSASGYWTRPTEMFARAFEAYVHDRLLAMGARSDYLVHGVESERFAGGAYKGNPYPVGAERAAIGRAFDDLFATVQTRKTDRGVAMFHRADDAERHALRALSENDELFALPRSEATTIERIAGDIDPQIKVRRSEYAGKVMYRLSLPRSSFAIIVERKPNPGRIYGYEDDSNERPITTLPGENPEDADPDRGEVYIDVSHLSPGQGGREVYAIAANYAHNTDRLFIGDPAGLSDDAMRRRPEQMLSSALKFGTTRHLVPHPRQVEGDASLGVPPLKWRYGDDLGNIRRLVDLNLEALENAGADEITFDPSTGNFLDADGAPLGRDGIAARVAAGTGRAARAGGTTLARGAVLRALLREEGAAGSAGGRRDGLLARLARWGSHPAARGTFYARQPGATAGTFGVGDVRAAVGRLTVGWANAPEIEILDSMSDAPAAARRENERQLLEGATGVPAAFFMDGKVYLVADQLRGERAVVEAVLHEALGHYGLRGVFGDALDGVLKEMVAARSDDVRAKAREYGLDWGDPQSRLRAAEEVLAELAQKKPTIGWVRRAVAAIRAWLRERVPGFSGLALSDDEIVNRFILPARGFVLRGRGGAHASDPSFSRGEPAKPTFFSALAQQIEAVTDKALTATGWDSVIRGLLNRGVVKRPEVEWSGLNEWLKLQPGRVTKARVLEFLADHGVQVQEVVHGTDNAVPSFTVESADAGGRTEYIVRADGAALGRYNTRAEAQAEIDEIKALPASELAGYAGTRYGQLVTPGATRRRELLLILRGAPMFQTAHWDESNVLAHARVGELRDSAGRRVLMVDELQGDWGQQLRQTARKASVARHALRDLEARPDADPAEIDRLRAELDEAEATAPPKAPFAGTTDAWVTLALKSIVRYGAENGFDRVALATGKQVWGRFPWASEEGSTRAGMSAFYGEHDGRVTDDKGRATAKTPIVHNVARALLRDLGGGELVPMTLRIAGGKTQKNIGFDISPAMREKVSQGVPLFSRAGPARAATGEGIDGADPEVRFQRVSRAAREPAGDGRDYVSGPLDWLMRKGGGELARDWLTQPVMDRVLTIGARLVPEKVKAGTVSDWGLDAEYLDRKLARDVGLNHTLREVLRPLQQFADLSREESRVAYLWMQEKPDTELEQRLLQKLSSAQRERLAGLKQTIDQLGRKAVAAGLLSEEAYQRNRMAYLHRSYAVHETAMGSLAGSRRAAAIAGDTYKGRGILDSVERTKVEEFAGKISKGDKLLRIERRGAGGRLLSVRYVPPDTALPDGFVAELLWEVRSADGDKIGLWRDLTVEERQRLGEIDEVRFAVAKTVLSAARDVENATFLEWVAGRYGKDALPAGAKEVKASESYWTLQTFGKNDWVRVPETKIVGVDARKFGALAGKYIPAAVWNDIRNHIAMPEGEIAKLYHDLTRLWKISRTALSPTVHTNNVMANFVLADLADLGAHDVVRSLRTLMAAKRGDAAAKALLDRYLDSGAEHGSVAAQELRTDFIAPVLDQIERDHADQAGALRLAQIVSLAAHGKLGEAGAALKARPLLQAAGLPFKTLIRMYQTEDSVFRLAKFLKEIDHGTDDVHAGKAAREAFLDYDINAPWIQTLRRSGLPFLAFSYRAIPLLIRGLRDKPWKMAKYLGVLSALNAVSYALLGMGDDDAEKERRRNLPKELQGNALGVFPRAIRLPTADRHGSPLYLDIRRWIPAGDVFDLNGDRSALPLPQWLTWAGPLSLVAELMQNKNAFTGKPIVLETDTLAQATVKVLDHVFKWAAPNIALPGPGYAVPGLDHGQFQTYAWQGIADAAGGKRDGFGREASTAQAVARAFGVRLGSYPEDAARLRVLGELSANEREISSVMAADAGALARREIDRAEFDRRMARSRQKLRDAAGEARDSLR